MSETKSHADDDLAISRSNEGDMDSTIATSSTRGGIALTQIDAVPSSSSPPRLVLDKDVMAARSFPQQPPVNRRHQRSLSVSTNIHTAMSFGAKTKAPSVAQAYTTDHSTQRTPNRIIHQRRQSLAIRRSPHAMTHTHTPISSLSMLTPQESMMAAANTSSAAAVAAMAIMPPAVAEFVAASSTATAAATTKALATTKRPRRRHSSVLQIRNFEDLDLNDSEAIFLDEKEQKMLETKLQQSAAFGTMIDLFWVTFQPIGEASDDFELPKELYTETFVAMFKALHSNFDMNNASTLVKEEWIRDVGGDSDATTITKPKFTESLIELCICW